MVNFCHNYMTSRVVDDCHEMVKIGPKPKALTRRQERHLERDEKRARAAEADNRTVAAIRPNHQWSTRRRKRKQTAKMIDQAESSLRKRLKQKKSGRSVVFSSSSNVEVVNLWDDIHNRLQVRDRCEVLARFAAASSYIPVGNPYAFFSKHEASFSTVISAQLRSDDNPVLAVQLAAAHDSPPVQIDPMTTSSLTTNPSPTSFFSTRTALQTRPEPSLNFLVMLPQHAVPLESTSLPTLQINDQVTFRDYALGNESVEEAFPPPPPARLCDFQNNSANALSRNLPSIQCEDSIAASQVVVNSRDNISSHLASHTGQSRVRYYHHYARRNAATAASHSAQHDNTHRNGPDSLAPPLLLPSRSLAGTGGEEFVSSSHTEGRLKATNCAIVPDLATPCEAVTPPVPSPDTGTRSVISTSPLFASAIKLPIPTGAPARARLASIVSMGDYIKGAIGRGLTALYDTLGL
ncbi:hypothetical protein D9615_001462 [Tricholomella constricta]|uniref:Uncharacterized protein n=1 Tax=Tricholomella constricta TaxID=117010 RepID=A0A8H5M916_9AGAR|nr:hypothetical protein D9615_001462 [Tricholomella constricta]